MQFCHTALVYLFRLCLIGYASRLGVQRWSFVPRNVALYRITSNTTNKQHESLHYSSDLMSVIGILDV